MTTGILAPMAGVFEGHAVVDNEKHWCGIQNSGEYGFRLEQSNFAFYAWSAYWLRPLRRFAHK